MAITSRHEIIPGWGHHIIITNAQGSVTLSSGSNTMIMVNLRAVSVNDINLLCQHPIDYRDWTGPFIRAVGKLSVKTEKWSRRLRWRHPPMQFTDMQIVIHCNSDWRQRHEIFWNCRGFVLIPKRVVVLCFCVERHEEFNNNNLGIWIRSSVTTIIES